MRGDHEVGRDGLVAQLAQDGGLGTVVAEELVGREPVEVDGLRRVRERQRRAGWQHLLPRGVALAPERGAPGGVECVDRAVPGLQPTAERLGGDVAVAVRVVAAELVRHVPEPHGGVVAVAFGGGADQGESVLAVDRGARAERLAATGPAGGAVGDDGQDLGVRGGEPRRCGGGARAEVDPDARAVQQLDDGVERGEVVLALPRLDVRPAEDVDRDEVHAGLAHEPDVLDPHLGVPLLGVVVAPEREARRAEAERAGGGRRQGGGRHGDPR